MANNLCSHGVPADRIRALQAAGSATAAVTPPKPPVRVKPKTLDDFRKEFDNPQKIRNGLAALSNNSYLTEEEFRQFCKIPSNLWRRNAELPEFADNKLKVAGIVHWASKSTIQEMKTIIGSA
jgi:hypothetical protein